MDRIALIQKSLTALFCGVAGYFPIVGLIPAVYAVSCWVRIRARCRNEWNPASFYLNLGAALGLLGVLNTVIVVLSAALTIASG